MEMETKRGIITRLVEKQHYGFIRGADGRDIFFHALGLIEPKYEALREGMTVEFFEVPSPHDRTRAIGVVVV